MKWSPAILAFALFLAGCNSGGSADANNDATSSAAATNTAPPTASGNGGGVTPMASGMAGGATPMAGTESVQGSGGGSVAMGAKDYAKRKIAGAGGSSVSQMPDGDSGQ